MHKIYLAGPIAGQSYEEARYGWRSEFKNRFLQLNAWADIRAGIYGPMRGNAFLHGVEEIKGHHDADHYAQDVVSSPHGIVGRDRYDVGSSSIVVVNGSVSDRASVGSCIEVGWADAARVPIVLITSSDPEHWSNHVMLRQMSTYAVHTVEEAVQLCTILLGPGL